MEAGGQSHALAALHLGETHCTHFIGGWVDPRANLDINKPTYFKIYSSVLSFEITFLVVLKYVYVQ
jgi:hypothetical protein